MLLRNRTLAFGCAGLLVASLCFAAEPTVLDAPELAPGVEASTIIHLDVTAGVSGAPNGFTIEWMPRTTYDALGGWPAEPTDPAIMSAFFLGSPTLNTVEGTISFLLGPGELATIEIGDIFDETGVQASNAGEVTAGTEYVVRVRANGEGGLPTGGDNLMGGNSAMGGSGYSPTCHAWTKHHDDREECVHSQGYWKNHPEKWPVSTLRLGNVIYTKTQLLAIWNKPAAGNGLISMAHQLMAAKLNVIAGAIPPSSVVGAISTADALIGNKIVPPVGAGYIAPSTSSHLTDDLEEFNTEESGEINCHQTTAARSSTWGEVKARYRY
jgi:hypothetical protein